MCVLFQSGCADFVPSCLDPGSQFGAASYESFGEVVGKASGWVAQQTSVRITNVQSVDYKLTHVHAAHCNNSCKYIISSKSLQ